MCAGAVQASLAMESVVWRQGVLVMPAIVSRLVTELNRLQDRIAAMELSIMQVAISGSESPLAAPVAIPPSFIVLLAPGQNESTIMYMLYILYMLDMSSHHTASCLSNLSRHETYHCSMPDAHRTMSDLSCLLSCSAS